MNSNLDQILEDKEQIRWQGGISSKILTLKLFTLLFILLLFSGAFLGIAQFSQSFAWLSFLVCLAFILVAYFSDRVKVFTITDKRIIIKSGLIGTDYNSIYFTEVKTADVSVGLIDKIFSVGTITINTGKIESIGSKQSQIQIVDKLSSIDTPYAVYKILQSTLSSRQESLYSGRADQK